MIMTFMPSLLISTVGPTMADKPGWRVSLSLAGIGILGALLGSAVQHFYALVREWSKTFEARHADAYVALMDAFDTSRMSRQAEIEGRRSEADELMKQYELGAGAAVRRIAIFGEKRVVEALAKWYRTNDLPPCVESLKPEIATWQTMRDALLEKIRGSALTTLPRLQAAVF